MCEDKTRIPEPVNRWYLAEFVCWTTIVLVPILAWINGPAVSTDQFVVRVSVFVVALLGAVSIRVAKIIRRRIWRWQ